MTHREFRAVRSSQTQGRKRRRGAFHQWVQRSMRLEALEDRRLMAVGPRLITVQPNDGGNLQTGATLNVEVVDLTFRFDDGQVINPATLDGVRLIGSGFDGVFGDPIDGVGDDIVIQPGFLGIGDRPHEVVMRLEEPLADDNYRIEVLGAGNRALENIQGEPFNNGSDLQLDFNLNLGPQVVAVVPQPIRRTAVGLTQARRQIEVYFNNDDLPAAVATNANFYQLIFTNDTIENTDDARFNPTSVTYDPVANLATLTFDKDLDQLVNPRTGAPVGTANFRLRIGTNEAAPAPPTVVTVPTDPGSSFSTSNNLGLLTQSLVLGATIDPQPNPLDFVGSEDEPGHRDVQIGIGNGTEQHVNPTFGPDRRLGLATVLYNFHPDVGFTQGGEPISNLITEEQRQRIREAFEMWGAQLGVQFLETADQGLHIATADPTAIRPGTPDVINYAVGRPTPDLDFIVRIDPTFANGKLILDAARQWQNTFGDDYYRTALTGIGFLLGLGHAGDLPAPTTMALGSRPIGLPPGPPAEQIMPGNADILHGQFIHRPDSNDIDLYKFRVDLADAALTQKKTAVLAIETFAERRPNSSLLDTVVTLYREVEVRDGDGNLLGLRRELVARNDDYYSEDSYIEIEVGTGTYYVQVTSTGNNVQQPEQEGTGYGGTTQGPYTLRLDLRPKLDGGNVLRDLEGAALDGDGDGSPGGVYNYWFRAARPSDSIYVDKAHRITAGTVGTLANPFNTIDTAFAAAQPGDVVRIVGNGGTDRDLTTLDDNFAYEIGTSPLGVVLDDGATMEVPRGVTAMIDSGAILKLLGARIGVGSSSLTIDRSGGALQVLGTPKQSVFFTSWLDEEIGLDPPVRTVPNPGDWGGIRFSADLDNAEGRFNLENEGVFLNYVNHADMRYGGGRLSIESVEQVVQPVQMIQSRPTVTYNVITRSADAALSADPDSFRETNFHSPEFQLLTSFTSDYQRIGPEIHDNRLIDNSTNGLFVSILTPAGDELQKLTVAARFDDLDVVHVLAENLEIQGTPGSALLDTVRPPVDLVALSPRGTGTLAAGRYNYKLVFFDRNGFEGRPSEATADVTLGAGQGSVRLTNLPSVIGDYIGRRLYRSSVGGVGPYRLVAELNRTDTTFVDQGAPGTALLQRDVPDVSNVTLAALAGGTLPAGSYHYRVTFVGTDGTESPASDATASLALAGLPGNATIRLANLPVAGAGFTARRIYRSQPGGTSPHVLVAEINRTATAFDDTGSTAGGELDAALTGVVRARTDARLRIDPGIVVKSFGARIEASFGSQLIAEGRADRRIIFTSLLDDRYGAGGTFDTPSDGGAILPSPADWGGIYLGQTAAASIDYALLTYGGGDTRIEGTFIHSNIVEVHQASLRLAHSVIENNDDGVEFLDSNLGDRIGRGTNEPATLFMRGSQPILLENIIRNNVAQAMTLDANSFTPQLLNDVGRETGNVGFLGDFSENYGPLIRFNVLQNNPNNGLNIRGATLTTQSVWDDSDITHVLFEEILVPNFHSVGGLRLQSSPTSSLVVKLGGPADPFEPHLSAESVTGGPVYNIDARFDYRRAYVAVNGQSVQRITQLDGSVINRVTNTVRQGVDEFRPTSGITATGTKSGIEDRIGGIVHVVGQPDFPVVLSSWHDDDLGAGFRLDGQIQRDTNNNAKATVPTPGDWRSVRLEQFSHDRNVEIIIERESPGAEAPGPNATPASAQFLGDLASGEKNSDDNLRLGFEVQGLVNAPSDVDVFSFTAAAGTEVWFDIDRTGNAVDTVVELISGNGQVLARSDNSMMETVDPSLLFRAPSLPATSIGPLQKVAPIYQPRHASGIVKDFYSQNPLDAGMRVILPGAAGTRSSYHVRVRSSSDDLSQLLDGETAGSYQLQVRLRETDELPGSTVRNADIRYAMNGIEVIGLPGHSPLLGEAGENELVGGPEHNNQLLPDRRPGVNTPGIGPQDLGNLLLSDRGALSVAGNLSLPEDIDFFQFEVRHENLASGNTSYGHTATIFDIDYADGLSRPNTNLSVFDRWGRLVLFAQDSNIADDQMRGGDLTDLSTGSAGNLDPYIGSVMLPDGVYFAAVTSNASIPRQLASSPQLKREPVNSVSRIVEDHIDNSAGFATPAPPDVSLFIDDQSVARIADVSAYIIRDTEATLDESDVTRVDINTGTVLFENLAFPGNAEDLTSRFNGTFVGFSTPDDDPVPNDFNTGLLRGLDTDGGQWVGAYDDGIETYREHPTAPGVAIRADVGIRFNAAAYGFLNGQEVLFAVGQRGDKDLVPQPPGPRAFNNLMYRFDPQTARATSAPQADRTGNARLLGGGTQIVERGILNTNAGGGPGGTITGLEIINNQVYALSDTGGLFRVNNPFSDTATLTFIRDLTPPGFTNPTALPSPIFGVVAEVEENNSPTTAQNLDAEIWTQRNDPNIANSTTFEHLTIHGRGDSPFERAFVANRIATLDGPEGIALGPDGDLYVASRVTSEILEFDGTTGELVRVVVGSGAGGLLEPTGITFGPDGNLYVSSGLGFGEILRFHAQSGLLIDSFAGAGILSQPMGLTFYDNGAGDSWLLVADQATSLIHAFDATDGSYLFDIDPGNTALIAGPSGIVADPVNEFLYVSSEFSNEVMRYDLATQTFDSVFVVAGAGGLASPHLGLALDSVGNLYVSSFATDEVLRYDNTGAFDSRFVRPDLGGLNGPAGLVFDPSGRLLVASFETDKVLRYSTAGGFVDSLVPADAGGLDSPRDLVFDAAGNLYVTSAELSDSVLKFDSNGRFLRAIVRDSLGGLDDPWGIAISPHDGSLLVASQGTHQVLRYNATTGAFLGAFVTTRSGGLDSPTGITFGPDGDLYVSSFGRDAVLRYDGTTGAFDRLYVVPSANLSGPTGLSFGPGNDLYVAGLFTNNIAQYDGPSEATAGRFVDDFIAPNPDVSEPQDFEFTATDLYVVNGGLTSSIVRFNLSDGMLRDVFAPPFSDGLDAPVGIARRPGTQLLYVASSGNDQVLEFDATRAPTFDYFKFSVEEDETQVIIDVDFADMGGPNDPDTQLFLLDVGGGIIASNDDFSPLAGGTGSTRRTDAILGGDRNDPLILNRGTYLVAIDESVAGADALDDPLDFANTYVLHVSMDKRRDTAEGPVVVRQFEGLARRPQEVAGDRFQNVLFAVDSNGDVYSYTLAGTPLPFFPGGATQIATGAAHARGIALSSSLWHRTTTRHSDTGHGLSEVFDDSRGGSLTIPENEPNNTPGSAHDLELERWTVGYDSNIGDDFDDNPISINTSTFIPHITVEGRGNGSVLTGTATRDFYSFIVTKPDSYVQIETDFDLAYQHRAHGAQPGNDPAGPALPYGEGVMDSVITLFNAAGGILASNNDLSDNRFGDGGTSWGTPDSSNTIDNDDPSATHESYLDLVLQPGVYIVEVRKVDPETGLVQPPEEEDRYTLQISVEGHEVTRDERLDGGASFFFGTQITGPVLNATVSDPVQITSPQHGLLGGEIVYVEGVRGIRQANGTYLVSRVDDDIFELIEADGTDEPFQPDGPYEGGGTWRLAALQRDMQATLLTNAFSLEGYAAADKPVLYFNHLMNLDPAAGDFRVSVVREGIVLGQILDKADLTNVTGACGDTNPFSPCPRDIWRQARVELGAFAGRDKLQLLFEFDTRGMADVAFEGVFLDDFVIGTAERGEMISGAYNNATFVPFTGGPPNEILTGPYQLEIRRATPFGVSQPVGQGAPNDTTLRLAALTNSNDRLANQTTLVAPAGSAIIDGQTFVIQDGNRSLTFEYDSNNILSTPGSSRVRFTPIDSDSTVAASIQAAINSSSVQRVLNVQAAPGGHAEVHLFGNAIVDPAQIQVRLHQGFGDSNVFRDQGQVLITSNFVTESQDFGIRVTAGERDHGERNPAGLLNSHYGAPRNLPALNSQRLAPGVTLENNVVAGDGLGGILLSGDVGVWELVPSRPLAWPVQETNGSTAGDRVADGDAFIITAFGQDYRFEFEDISGDAAPAGSDSQGGNGWTPGSYPIFYRRSSGYLVLRGIGFSQTEMVYAIREAIHASPLGTSSLQVNPTPGSSRGLGGALLGADPALYLSHAGNVRVVRGAPFAVNRRTPLHAAAQPLAKVVNNTVYGSDGLASQFVGNPRNEPNDIVSQSITTHQGRSNLPARYVAQGNIGDGVTTPADPSLDVDMYRIYMGIGDRVIVDVDASERGTGLNSVVRLFNSLGQEVARSDDQSAPGESFSFDPYLDFTTLEAGTYYVGLSGVENNRYSALGLGGLVGPASRGDYTIEIDVQSADTWLIRAVDGTLVPDGTTITVSDRIRTVVFELDSVNAPGVVAGNVPIVYNPTPVGNPRGPGFRPPEMAVVIAEAIAAQFPNTIDATALPGFRGVTAGVKNLPTPLDFNGQNFGHDYDPTRIFYGAPATQGPFATSELYAVIRGAANVTLPPNSPFTIGANPADPTIVDQMRPEMGILILGNASPTLLNNLVANVHTGIWQENSGTTIMGASLFQHNVVDHNINPLNESFSITLDPRDPLFVSADERNFYPAPFTRAIDSSIDSLEDRDAFVSLKRIVGIGPSPVLAPDRDASGQLRIDDSTVDPPDGFGANVFKDRGGIDRADFEGPDAVLINPRDNDATRLDLDSTETVVQLTNPNLSHISIQLVDRAEGSGAGIGVDDTTVTPQKLTLIQNGVLLSEGVDYEYDYDARTNTIRLTHISGLWPNNSVYVVRLANRDRFVIEVPDGSRFQDGQSFFIEDAAGNTVTFEYESGYSLFIPETLTLRIPGPGAGPVGISDGQRFTVFRPGGLPVTFEYDSNVPPNFVAGNRPINIAGAATADEIALATISALTAAAVGLTPVHLGDGVVHLGARAGHRIDATLSNVVVTGQGDVIADGQTLVVGSVVFEFENTAIGDGVAAGNTPILFSDASTQNDLAEILIAAITNAGLGLTPSNLGEGHVLIGGQPNQVVDASGAPQLRLVGAPGVQGTTRLALPGPVTLQVPSQGTGVGGIADPQFVTIDDGVRNAELALGFAAPNDINTAIRIAGSRQLTGLVVEFRGGLAGNTATAQLDTAALRLTVNLNVAATTSTTIVNAINALGVPSLSATLDLRVDTTNNGSGTPQTVGVLGALDPAVKFEFDLQPNSNGVSPGAVAIPFQLGDTLSQLGDAIAAAIASGAVGLSPTHLGGGLIDLGVSAIHVVDASRSNLIQRGKFGGIADGETFVIDNLFDTNPPVTFEFDRNNRVTAGNRAIRFTASSSQDNIVDAMIAAISLARLDLQPLNVGGGVVDLRDSHHHTTDVVRSSLERSGVPGGAVPVQFVPDSTFTPIQLADTIIAALGGSVLSGVTVSVRGADTYFLDGVASVGGDLPITFIGAIQDLADNNLLANQPSNETKFTILMPGVQVDYGDAPASYPTLFANNAARHAIVGGLFLGTGVDAELEGLASAAATGDDRTGTDDEDGVVFGSIFNAFLVTPTTVTAAAQGFLDAWVDFNRDGDWNDPGEQVFNSQRLEAGANELGIATPSSAQIGRTFARFRFSSSGNLVPSGLAADGEVEDYQIEIVGGTPPVANDDSYTTHENAVLSVLAPGVLDNDTDVDGDALSVIASDATTTLGVGVTMNANGSFVYDPSAVAAIQALAVGDSIDDTFTYRAGDGILPSQPATVTIRVNGRNDNPTAANGTANATEDGGPVTGAFTGDDVDTDDDPTTLSYSIVAVPAEGSVTNNGDGTFTFDPGTDFQDLAVGQVRNVTFTYRATDRHGATSSVGRITVAVTGTNDAPVAANQSINATEDGSAVGPTEFAGDDIDSDDDQASLTYAIVTDLAAGQGTVTNHNDGTFTYDPGNAFQDLALGETAEVSFTYRATDSHGLASAVGRVTVTITGVNDRPVAVQNDYQTDEETVLQGNVVTDDTGLGVDSDPDGDAIQVSRVNGSAANVGRAVTLASGAILTVQANGTFSYDPTSSATLRALAIGERFDDSFTYTVSDGRGGLSTATVNVAVFGANEAPDATNDTYRVAEGGTLTTTDATGTTTPGNSADNGVLANDSDPEDEPLTITIVTEPQFGVLTMRTNGTFTYVHDGSETTRDTFVYRISDPTGGVSEATVTINVTPVNDRPVAVADSYAIDRSRTLRVLDPDGTGTPNTAADNGVLVNDSDPEGSRLTARLVSGPTHASAFTLNSDGTFTYTHNGNTASTDSFTYVARDGSLDSAVTTVTITINAPPPPPWQNPRDPRDVNNDGSVSPIDALLIVNFLNFNQQNNEPLPVPDETFSPPPFYDVNGDGFASPVDVALVISFLNSRTSRTAEGESGRLRARAAAPAVEDAGSDSLVGPVIVQATAAESLKSNDVEQAANQTVGVRPAAERLPRRPTASPLEQTLVAIADDVRQAAESQTAEDLAFEQLAADDWLKVK